MSSPFSYISYFYFQENKTTLDEDEDATRGDAGAGNERSLTTRKTKRERVGNIKWWKVLGPSSLVCNHYVKPAGRCIFLCFVLPPPPFPPYSLLLDPICFPTDCRLPDMSKEVIQVRQRKSFKQMQRSSSDSYIYSILPSRHVGSHLA